MLCFRVTKFDPRFRDASGAYTRDDWISIGDIGSEFDGVILTPQSYLAVENAYISTALAFFDESGIESLQIGSLENHGEYSNSELTLANGHVCSILEIADIARLNLRCVIWCRLSSDTAFLHFGYDYYMYIGVPAPCPHATEFAHRSGLFVESFDSPYRNVT